MNAVLALAGMRADRHVFAKSRYPMGTRFASKRKIPRTACSILIAGMILLMGCERRDNESTVPEPASRDAETPARPLPGEPWFELPADWDAQHPVLSPNAKTEAHFTSLAEKQIDMDPGDGQGRAWLESITPIDPKAKDWAWRRDEGGKDRPTLPASTLARFEIGFEVGEPGIEEGGILFVMPEPYWSWSEAQVIDPRAPGYTTAVARDGDVQLEPSGPGAQFQVTGRRLAPGERIDIVLGAGPIGTRVDEFAERGSEVLIAVDGSGDGYRHWLKESVRIDVAAHAGDRIVGYGPAEAAPGESIEISISILDANGNRALWPSTDGKETDQAEAHFEIERTDGGALAELGLSNRVTSRTSPHGPHRIRLSTPTRNTTIRLSIRGLDALDGLETRVNPIVVRNSGQRLAWGDLHGHSQLSDGTGTPEDYFGYARDVARLDIIALTDHDHWSVRPLDEAPEAQARIADAVRAFNEPGRFVTLPGYEWTSWLHGHRHVLYFEEEAPIFSAIDPATDRPDELWNALRGKLALTFAHHSAGEPVATNWYYPPDPELEPLTEISSVHGSSEAPDAPLAVRGGIPGNFVRDVLNHGYRLGFIGSGDSHDGHPGLTYLITGQAGLAAIYTESLDRASLLEAMKQRRTFATNGIRPFFEVFIDETFMGGELPESSTEHTLRIRYEATAPIERIDLIRSGRVAAIEGGEALSLEIERTIPRLQPSEFHYVRIIQVDGGVAWSSPIFAMAPSATTD
jgi:hypothetical protein